MKLSAKLAKLYTSGYTRADVVRMTNCTEEAVAAWEEGQANESDEAARSLLLRVAVSEFGAFLEQQKAIDALLSKGLRRTQIAWLVCVGANSVRAWDGAVKLARGRARARLLSHASMTAYQLSKLAPAALIIRGRLPPEEIARRIAAMKKAGLWPFEERASRLKLLLERAGQANITTTEVIDSLGMGRRAFYDSLSAESMRLVSVETVRRYQQLSVSLGFAGGSDSLSPFTPPTIEERFIRASLLLFEEYHYVGFTPRDPVKENALRMLAQATGYHERTLRRYLPLRVDPQRRVPRMMVEAFEEVARQHGSLVHAKV